MKRPARNRRHRGGEWGDGKSEMVALRTAYLITITHKITKKVNHEECLASKS